VKPFLSVEAGGPTALVTGMAFSPDGRRLYVAGFDKVIHVYEQNADGRFEHQPAAALRVPIGPGLIGSLFDLAISPDGKWLAAGGRGRAGGEAGFRDNGWIWPKSAMKEAQREDQGVIFVWNTESREVTQLRGHKGIVIGLAFAANSPKGSKPALVSAAAEGADSEIGAVLVWDLDKRTSKPYPNQMAANPYRPGLIAWQSQNGALLVGISWFPDRLLRLWDVTAGKTWQTTLGENNQALAYCPDQDRVLTGDFLWENGKGSGELKAWRVFPGANLRAEEAGRHIFPSRQNGQGTLFAAPQVLALFPSRAGGPLDTAAIAVRLTTGGQRPSDAYELVLLDITPANFDKPIAIRARMRLWETNDQPYLGISADGRHLSIASAAYKNPRIVDLRELLAGNETKPQVLRSAGVPLGKATFLRHRPEAAPADQPPPSGAWRGLLVIPSGAGNKPTGLVFDFRQRTIAEYRADGWINDSAGAEDAGVAEELRRALARVPLSPRQTRTAAAYLPSGPPLQVPLLALAYNERGEPGLQLYNATSGSAVRQFTGHLGTIRHLEFDRDGKYLVSVADDQTLCVWSLTDLDQNVNKHGLLTGVTVSSNDQGQLYISGLYEPALDPANAGKLQKDDIIERLVVGNKPYKLTTKPDSFYAAIWPAHAGEEVLLKVRDRPELRLRVGQAIDERKPLFSLFLIREEAEKADRWHWIGWSPLGAYDASSRDAERYLGWHFNLLRAERPTSFAPADQYRDQYARKGLLQALLEKGNLADALASLPPPNLPPLRLTILVTDQRQVLAPDADDQVIVKNPKVTLQLRPTGPALKDLKALRLQINGREAEPLDPQKETDWTKELNLAQRRNQVRVEVQTREETPQIVSRSLTLRYLPPAPQISPLMIAKRSNEDPKCNVSAMVAAGVGDQLVTIRLSHNGRQIDQVPNKKVGQDGWRFEKEVALVEGVNWLVLEAVNDGAEEPYLNQESASQVTEVVYTKKKLKPPEVSCLRLESTRDGGGKWDLSKSQQGVVRVNESFVRLLGDIGAEDKLSEAKLTGPTPGTTTNLLSNPADKLSIDQELRLKPGINQLELVARCQDSAPTILKVPIEYQPPLPRLTLVTPKRDEKFIAGTSGLTAIIVTAELGWGADAQPCDAELRINEKPFKNIHLDANKDKLQCEVPLDKLDNKRNLLQIRLRNEWKSQSEGEERAIYLLRPPRDLKLVPATPGDQPFLTVVATVRSPLPLQVENVKPAINGRPHSADKIVISRRQDEWRIELKDLPLKAGENQLALRVNNEDGEISEPVSATYKYSPPKPPEPPTIQWLEPGERVTRPEADIKWSVKSASAVRRSTVLVEGKPAPGSPQEVNHETGKAWQQRVTLAPGLNHVRIEVENNGGLQTEEKLISYIAPPVRLELREIDGANKSADGRWIAADKWVTLRGDIIWDPAPSLQELANCRLKVFANGFLQPQPRLAPATGKTRREFTARVLLTEKSRNHIAFRASNLALEEEQTALEIDCAKPDNRIEVNVLVVSDKPNDEKIKTGLIESVKKVFGKQDRNFQLRPVKPLLGRQVDEDSVSGWLQQIQEQMTANMSDGADGHNELLVVYYQGHEFYNAKFGVCWTTDLYINFGGRMADILTSGALEANLKKDCPGARLVLLDVASAESAGTSRSAEIVAQALDRLDAWSDAVAVLRLLEDGKGNQASLLGAWSNAAQHVRRLKELTDMLDSQLQNQATAQSPALWKKLAPPLRFLPVGQGD
jgi:WD40 repeat protein